MNVLQLKNTVNAFFPTQVAGLESAGVRSTTRTVPGATRARGPADYLRFLPTVAREGLTGRYDVVHANYGLVGPFAFTQPTRPVVVTLWGSDVMGEAWVRRVSTWAARRADAVVAPSKPIAAAVDVETTLVPFGVDTDRFRPRPRAESRERVGWDPEETIALFPYEADRPEKNYPLAETVAERADADVTVKTVSDVPHDRMPDYFNASDLLLVTSRREGGPMVVKEAAACNVPVVSTDVGFVRDVLCDVSNSHVASSTRELVEAVDAVVECGERADGRETIDVLSIEEMGAALRDVYERVL